MNQKHLIKTLIYCLSVAIMTALSFFIRNFLITNCNRQDFKLFSIDHLKNYGAAFSLFQNQTLLLIFISVAILITAVFYIFKNIEKFNSKDLFLTAILASGIIGNLTERILDGYVTDYFRLNFIAFPIFNTSDIFICAGAFMLICNILFNDERNK